MQTLEETAAHGRYASYSSKVIKTNSKRKLNGLVPLAVPTDFQRKFRRKSQRNFYGLPTDTYSKRKSQRKFFPNELPTGRVTESPAYHRLQTNFPTALPTETSTEGKGGAGSAESRSPCYGLVPPLLKPPTPLGKVLILCRGEASPTKQSYSRQKGPSHPVVIIALSITGDHSK